MAYSEGHEISQYRTLEVLDDKVLALHEKGVTRKNLKPYIGLAGVYNYQEFWQEMQKGGSEVVRVGESYGLRSLVDRKMAAYGFEWFDTGNTLALKQTRKKYETPGGPVILDKENEAIWFVGNKVIKFSDDKNFVANRVKRSESINEFVPKVIGSRENFYIYEKAEGQTVSECVTLPLFSKLLDHSKSFWQKKDLNSSEEESLRSHAYNSIRIRLRIELIFLQELWKIDSCQRINGESISSMADLLNKVDWKWLSSGEPVRFHGDFHFDNILVNTDRNSYLS